MVQIKDSKSKKRVFGGGAALPQAYFDILNAAPPKQVQHIAQAIQNDDQELKGTRIVKKDVKFFPIWSRKNHAWQVDLTFHPVQFKNNTYVNQAILCMVNINTRFAAAWPLDYTLPTRYNIDTRWKGTREDPPSIEMVRKLGTSTHSSAKVLNAMLHCLIYIYNMGQKVDEIYSDAGKEFMGIVSEFCRDPRMFFKTHSEFEGKMHKFAADMGMQLGNFFAKLPPNIKWTMFDPNTGSKRRMGIVERFNRTLKDLMRKVEKTFDGKGHNWERLILHVVNKYNVHDNHRTLHKVLGASKDQDVTPFSASVPYEDDGKVVIPEENIKSFQNKKTKDIWKFYSDEDRLNFLPGDAVVTKRLKTVGKYFTKLMDEPLHKGTVSKQEGNSLVISTKNGPLKRKYQPWEIMKDKRVKDVHLL